MTPWSVDVVLTWRYFGSVDNDNVTDELEPKMDEVNYIDLAATWNVTDNIQLRGTVLNLFAEDPPIFSGAGPALGNGNTYPTVYDTGTVFFGGVKFAF